MLFKSKIIIYKFNLIELPWKDSNPMAMLKKMKKVIESGQLIPTEEENRISPPLKELLTRML